MLSETSGIVVQAFRRIEGSLPRQLKFWVASWVWRTKPKRLYKEASSLREENLYTYTPRQAGRAGSPYEGGIFHLRISLSEKSSSSSGEEQVHAPTLRVSLLSLPRITFLMPIYQPNINTSTGAICLHILNEYSCALTLEMFLMCILALRSIRRR